MPRGATLSDLEGLARRRVCPQSAPFGHSAFGHSAFGPSDGVCVRGACACRPLYHGGSCAFPRDTLPRDGRSPRQGSISRGSISRGGISRGSTPLLRGPPPPSAAARAAITDAAGGVHEAGGAAAADGPAKLLGPAPVATPVTLPASLRLYVYNLPAVVTGRRSWASDWDGCASKFVCLLVSSYECERLGRVR